MDVLEVKAFKSLRKGKDAARGARVMVAGLGVTGLACARALPKFGAETIVTDLKDEPSAADKMAIAKIEEAGARFLPLSEAAGIDADALILSPGIPTDDERLIPLKTRAGAWMSEIELAYLLCEGRILAVTGTNGKTTTATLAGRILSGCFEDTRVAGNIGDAFIEAAVGSGPKTVFVIEASSYQLEGCFNFRPDAAIELNVQPDHLKRHGTMAAYAAAKARLLTRMTESGTAVLNADDMLVAAMAQGTRAGIINYSVERELERGAFLRGGEMILRQGGEEEIIGDAREMKIRGPHNEGNALAAAAATRAMGAPVEKIREALKSFEGLKHRIETVGFVRGVECVNDSKATNPDSTRAALKMFAGRAVTLIMCGDDKGFDYNGLYDDIEAAGAKVIVMGDGLARVAGELGARGAAVAVRVDDMASAVRTGLEMTPEGGALLLSPGSSSFDRYKNYEERGEDFRNEVRIAE
jgi:UDP-N-acetylmuramoylalanine--D-glutamate ligase